MEHVIVKLDGGGESRRPLTDHEIAKMESSAQMAAEAEAIRQRCIRVLARLDVLEETEVVSDAPDLVTLTRIAVARRYAAKGQVPPFEVLAQIGIDAD